jgi:hypothetical protein
LVRSAISSFSTCLSDYIGVGLLSNAQEICMTVPYLSLLEISRIIEEAFLPEHCVCSSPDGVSLTIQVSPHNQPEKGMSFVGIPISGLTGSRAIAKLVLEIREEVLNGDAALRRART